MGNASVKDASPLHGSPHHPHFASVVALSQDIPGHTVHGLPANDSACIASWDSMAIIPPDTFASSARSPLTISSQIPQITIPQGDDVGRSWAGEMQNHDDTQQEPNIATLIEWIYGGNEVYVEGSWDNWSTRSPLHKAGKNFTLVKFLPSGVYHYKFVVNGEWRHSPDLPYVYDEKGNATNILDVQDYVPENLDSIAEFVLPGSPERSYDNPFPGSEEYSKDPPLLPPQLHLTTLSPTVNSSTSTSTSILPQHVILNHLFVETTKTACPMLALGFTHRFRSKYVTVILHKPLHR